MKTNTVFKRAHNQCLSLISMTAVGSHLGTESDLATALGVSRTTVRNILITLEESGIIQIRQRDKVVSRLPHSSDFFPDFETQSSVEVVEKKFMQWILREDYKSAQQINTLELARQFGVSTSAVREYLSRFSQFGLLERREYGGWEFKGFTQDFAEELSEVRDLFEIRSAQKFIELPEDHPAWRLLDQLEEQHRRLRETVSVRHTDFSELDERFHRLINNVVPNRFMTNFYHIISMIFHYHYHWNKVGAAERNRVAIEEHLAYIAALKSRDREAVMTACLAHLKTARRTLLLSIEHIESRA